MNVSISFLIICVVIVVVIASIVSWLFVYKKRIYETKAFNDERAYLENQANELKTDNKRLKESCDKKVEEANLQIDEATKQLEKANQQVAELENQLNNMLNGNVDSVIKAQLEDVDKLKKKIERLKKENEVLERDLDETESNLDEKEDKILELEGLVHNERSKNGKIKKDLEEKKEELNIRSKELSLKVESLDFIQEVLGAQERNEGNIAVLYKKVDDMVDFIHEDLSTCFGLSKDSWVNKDLDRWAIISKKSWIAGKKTIAFVGEFSAGKTSIVNRILSQDDPNVPLLPVSAKATTAIPTYIAGEIGTSYSFVSPDNRRKKIDEKTFKRVNKEVLDQVKGVSSLIQYFVMTYRNTNLRGLSILDTPGFNSNDSEDAQRTIDVINECDALFWVFDVNSGTVNRSSISLIKKYLKKPLYVVINKIDTKAITEVNKVEQLIRKTLIDEGVIVKRFIRFSEKEPLESIMEPIKSVEHNVEEDSYIDKLDTLLEDSVKIKENDKDAAFRLYNKKSHEVEEYTSRMNVLLHNLTGNCDNVNKIPQFKEGLEIFLKLTDDKYEMNEDQYRKFVDLLGSIKTQARNMNSISNSCTKAVKEQQKLYEDYNDKRESFRNAFACLQKFKKLRKELEHKIL